MVGDILVAGLTAAQIVKLAEYYETREGRPAQSIKVEPVEEAAFTVWETIGGHMTGRLMAVYASGRTVGFPPGYSVILNRIPGLIKAARAEGALMSDVPEMVERVARMLCRAIGDDPDEILGFRIQDMPVSRTGRAIIHADSTGPAWHFRIGEARAAIEAMREPTEAMLDGFRSASAVEWHSAIIAALGEQ